RVGTEASVAVHGRCGKHGGGSRVLEQAGKVSVAERREQLLAGEEVAAGAVAQRLVQVPAARVIALERRPRHERGEAIEAAANLARRRAKEQEIVRRAQGVLRRERALDLPGSPFVLERAQRQAERE